MKLHVMEIERFAIHDGPGIRTTVFLQGCPLACPWCANPESQQIGKHLMYLQKNCVGCGRCAAACPHGCITLREGRPVFDRSCCKHCGACANACMSRAIRFSGKLMEVDDIVATLVRDRSYYAHSGGGITVSGGEPFVQAAGLTALLRSCKTQRLHTAVETTGNVPPRSIAAAEPLIDLFLFDFKHPDAYTLKNVTGGDLTLIMANLRKLTPQKVVLRVPVIPGFNFDRETVWRIFEMALAQHITRVDLLAYHELGKGKYAQLGLPYRCGAEKSLTKNDLADLKALGTRMGLTMN